MISHVRRLFSEDGRHPKADKNLKVGVYSLIMHLAPANKSGYEVCPLRSAGCTAACLDKAGYHYARKDNARINRTRFFFEQRDEFMKMMVKEIETARRKAKKLGLRCGIRLNGTSDIPWENIACGKARNVMEVFPDVFFMDYTKRANRANFPRNYRLTFSRSETNDAQCAEAIRNGMNVAIVFRHTLPQTWMIGQYMLKVLDGDEHDWRYGDYDMYPNERVVIGLRAKGLDGRNDRSGFVVDVPRALEMAA